MSLKEEYARQSRVVLADASPNWSLVFDVERALIAEALGALARRIEHIGSTAIPNIKAKPIVDIAVGIRSLDDTPICVERLAVIDYEYDPEFEKMLPDHRYFDKTAAERTYVHLHVYEDDNPALHDYIHFRDWLRAHPEDARTYESLKVDLAERCGRAEYTQSKAPFIAQIVQKSRANGFSNGR